MTDWRGEWMSVHDLARLLGKKYDVVIKLCRDGTLSSHGLRLFRTSPRSRIYCQVDQKVLDALRVSLDRSPLHSR